MSRVKLLVAGDIHIGRVSSKVPADDAAALSARAAWERIVELAVEEKVDLLCLTGDVADESNRFWEALGPLERGLRTLENQGIRTLAVGGNHDHDVLPRLADQLESDAFRLLGRGGRWERHAFPSEDGPLLYVDGWSFPRERVRASPVDSYDLPASSATPTVAMVHGDLDAAESPYAPLHSEWLRARPVEGWLLGHIHAPMIDEPGGRPFILYPGSPQALDPGEPGMHGAVIVEFEHGRCLPIRRVALSTVRYDELVVDVSGVQDSADMTSRVRREISTFAEHAATEGGDRLRHLVLRLTLRGQTPLARWITEEETERVREDFELRASGVTCTVDRVSSRVLPEIDLELAARGNTPPAILASALLELRGDAPLAELSDRAQGLIQRVRTAALGQRRDPVYSGLREDSALSEQEARDLACEQAEAILIKLLEQRAGP